MIKLTVLKFSLLLGGFLFFLLAFLILISLVLLKKIKVIRALKQIGEEIPKKAEQRSKQYQDLFKTFLTESSEVSPLVQTLIDTEKSFFLYLVDLFGHLKMTEFQKLETQVTDMTDTYVNNFSDIGKKVITTLQEALQKITTEKELILTEKEALEQKTTLYQSILEKLFQAYMQYTDYQPTESEEPLTPEVMLSLVEQYPIQTGSGPRRSRGTSEEDTTDSNASEETEENTIISSSTKTELNKMIEKYGTAKKLLDGVFREYMAMFGTQYEKGKEFTVEEIADKMNLNG